MANGKNYSIREQILDQYLSSGHWYSRQQLEEFCNRELEIRGESLITSRTTIHNDLTEISNKYRVTIDTKRKGRVIYYKYRDSSFSIFSRELSQEDRDRVVQAMELLRKFEGMPQFEWVEEMSARFSTTLYGNKESKPIIGFEDSSYNKGMHFFTPLIQVIKERITIELTYKSFRMKEEQMFNVSPYYLKQYNNRWYLLARRIGYEKLGNYPLDRIVSFKNAGVPFEECDIDFEEYFEDVIGVTVPEEESQIVELWLAPDQLNYIETKPLHGSQTIVYRDEKGGIVRYDLKLNYELEQKILSFGEKAEVLAPLELKERIKSRVSDCLKKYQIRPNPVNE